MRALVCGGHEWGRCSLVWQGLDLINERRGITCVIHGAAPCVDTFAGEWAWMNGLGEEPYPMEPGEGGFARNWRMLEASQPHLVVHFPGGNGTKHMVGLAQHWGYELIGGLSVLYEREDERAQRTLL